MDNTSSTQVIGVASGKGGVGKTTVSVNLAVALQLMGHQVMLFDADLGLANAQIALGAKCTHNISHFLSGEKTLQEIIITTRSGVKLVPGASGVQEMADLSPAQIQRIVEAFSALQENVDFLIVDMAAGIAPSVLAFMAACQRRLIVVRDDPASIADAYGTIKVLIRDHGLDDIYLVPNGLSSQQDGLALFERITQVCLRFLNQGIGYLATIENDEQILAALKKYQSVLEFSAESSGARDFRRLAATLPELELAVSEEQEIRFFGS